MDSLPETEVKEDQTKMMGKDPIITDDINPDVKNWLSKIHTLTRTRYENYEKLRDIDASREEAHIKYRILIEDNMAIFKKDFPNASRALLAEFHKATFENTILDDLNAARKKQEIVYIASRDELAEMYNTFNNLYPEQIPTDVQNRDVVGFAATDNETVAAFFRICSPEDVAREIFTHKALPGFKICSCEKSFNRDSLPPSYRAKVERARQFPDNPGHLISYDTPGVIEKMRNSQRRKARDIYITTLETVWVYNSDIKKYEPNLNQQVFHKYSYDQVNGLRRRIMIYVEISIVAID